MSERLTEAVTALQKAILGLYDAVSDYDTDDADEAASFLIKLTDAKQDLAFCHGLMSTVVIRLLQDAPEITVDGRLIEKKAGGKRKEWQHDKLMQTVVSKLRDLYMDEETGEVKLTPEDAVRDIMKYAHIGYWRVTDLRELGVNADLYSTVEEGDPSLIVRKPSS